MEQNRPFSLLFAPFSFNSPTSCLPLPPSPGGFICPPGAAAGLVPILLVVSSARPFRRQQRLTCATLDGGAHLRSVSTRRRLSRVKGSPAAPVSSKRSPGTTSTGENGGKQLTDLCFPFPTEVFTRTVAGGVNVSRPKRGHRSDTWTDRR